jgi:anti-sigma-K factor RskA
MNLKRNPALAEQLAASYALGTLRGGARRRFETLARQDPALRAAALVWQSRMASMSELQSEVAPSAAVWKRIENLVDGEKQAQAMQAARQPAELARPNKSWWASLNLWRGLASVGTGAAVAAVLVSANLNVVNGKLNTELQALGGQVQTLNARLAATPEIQYVAVLADDKAAASVLVTFDPKSNRLTLKRVGGFQEPADQSLQLWALPQAGGARSLGVLGADPVVKLTAAGNDVNVPTLAISLEPKGGVPSAGGPTGPVLFKGAMIQTAL